MKHNYLRYLSFPGLLLLTMAPVPGYSESGNSKDEQVVAFIEQGNLRIEFNEGLYSRISALFDGKSIKIGDFRASEYLVADGIVIDIFTFESSHQKKVSDNIGKGTEYLITGKNSNFQKDIRVTIYDKYPAMALYSVTYTNLGSQAVTIERWVNNHFAIHAHNRAEAQEPFWSYLPGSYEERPDWVQPLEKGFEQENYLGMNATDYGGGTPVTDIWRKDVGIAVGHVEMIPQLVSLPVSMSDEENATLGVVYREKPAELQTGDRLTTYRTFVAVHQGDYFATMVNYRNFMIDRGMVFPNYPDTSYETIWCGWGYERHFTMQDIYSTLPKVKELGLQWVVIDDGWQPTEGDWYGHPEKFPQGDADMKAFVNHVHSQGLKAKLWWAPLAVNPGADLIKNHPEYLLRNEDQRMQAISWWDAYYLCPASEDVIEYTKELVKKFIGEWGFDGLKIDGQHLNAAPPCFHPEHHHEYPEIAYEAVPQFFKAIYDTAISIKPDAIIEICPCGTAYSFHTMPYFNQPVSSDPESSWQIRHKGKTFKALMGPDAPYYGDHVELSDKKNDFASTVGIGGVLGTKFTWPKGPERLTSSREEAMKKWLAIYEEKKLPYGTYLGSLYDIGFDRPEAHAIYKDGNMYYAFYARRFKGTLELRGLEEKEYTIYDYVRKQDFGTVYGPVAMVKTSFERYLLFEASPVE